MKSISFLAILNKITTTTDGGWRVTFDISANEGKSVLELSQMRDKTLSVGVVAPEIINEDQLREGFNGS